MTKSIEGKVNISSKKAQDKSDWGNKCRAISSAKMHWIFDLWEVMISYEYKLTNSFKVVSFIK